MASIIPSSPDPSQEQSAPLVASPSHAPQPPSRLVSTSPSSLVHKHSSSPLSEAISPPPHGMQCVLPASVNHPPTTTLLQHGMEHRLHLPPSSNPPSSSQASVLPTVSPSLRRKRRIRFSSMWDILLLKAVLSKDAHLSRHGEAQARFEETLTIFLSALPTGALDGICLPAWKTLSDRFKKIVADRKSATQTNATASGIIEIRGEREILLDDIVLAMSEWAEKRCFECEERTEQDRRLAVAGEEIRNLAVERDMTQPADGDNGSRSEDRRSTPGFSSRRRGRKRHNSFNSDEEERPFLNRNVTARREMEERRILLEEQRIAFEKEKDQRLQERMIRSQENESKRLRLEEKRIALEEEKAAIEKEERKQAISERKEMISVLGALVKKLQ